MKEKLVRVDISKIEEPSFVKELGIKSLTILAHDLRMEILKNVAEFGGHLSSNLGIVELTISLYRVFDPKKDKIIFDVGHQCYAQKLLTGRSLEKLGQEKAGAPFQDPEESIYDVYKAGHSSTSISAAGAFAIARDENKENYDVVAVIGDGSLASGLAFEGLNNIAANSSKAIIILNDNDMSISSPAGALGRFFRKISSQKSYNKAKLRYQRVLNRSGFGRFIYRLTQRFKNRVKKILVPTTLFDNMGFTYIGPVDGHNIKAIDKALKRAKNTTKSAIVHVYTKKGKGYRPAENDKEGLYHGVGSFDLNTGIEVSDEIKTWPAYMGSLAYDLLENDEKARLVCPAMINGSCLIKAFKAFPKRCYDVGIAEEHALTFSGALALNGYHPIVVVYSTFLQRAYDEIYHDVARLNVDLTLFIDRSGPVGKDGSSHQGLYDVAYLSSIPGTLVYQPATTAQAKYLAETSVNEPGHGLVAIRYSKDALKEKKKEENIRFDRMIFEGNGSDLLYIGIGPRGLDVYNSLASNNITYCNPLCLNKFHPDDLAKLASYKTIYIYDSYATKDGFSKNLALALSEISFKGRLIVRAFKTEFIEHASVEAQLKENNLDLAYIKKELKGLVG